MNDFSIDSRLLRAEVALSNALSHTEVLNMLGVFGYDEPKLQAGMALFTDASEKQQDKVREHGEKMQSTQELDAARATAENTYMKHLKVARVAFQEDVKMTKALGLNGRRKRSYSGWIEQCASFYKQALASQEAQDGLAAYNITSDDLTQGLNLVNEVDSKLQNQYREDAEDQNATQARDKALDKLEAWMGDFFAIARLALVEKPQYLEMLGIVEPS